MKMDETRTVHAAEPFDPHEFVRCLFDEGHRTTCDQSNESFQKQLELPAYYDHELFRRGQQFYHRHIFLMFFCKLLGLLTVLTIPSILRLLIHTNLSSTVKSAYRRYLATLFHMCVWYDNDFYPGSRTWESIKEVRRLHNSASLRGCAANMGTISQRDMALTQFGFMGYAVSRRCKVGIFKATNDDWKAFIHVWRVIGYMMGIDERFNICRDSVEETRQICEILMAGPLSTYVNDSGEDFHKMGNYLIDGMWTMNPTIHYNIYMAVIDQMISYNRPRNDVVRREFISESGTCKKRQYHYSNLSFSEKIFFNVLLFVVSGFRFDVVRIFHNWMQYFSLWLMRVFPFLAFYKFGFADSYVSLPIN